MTYPQIAEFIPSSMVDWDGRIASVIVLQGCNFRCPCCHSGRFVSAGPLESEVPWEAVERRFIENAGWLDGVVVSGGEPTIHRTLPFLLEELRRLQLPVKLDTNGSSPERLRELRRGAAFVEIRGITEYVIGPGDILLITLWRGTRVMNPFAGE